MDEGSVHTSRTLSTEHDSIYTYSITSERCLAGGSQRCPYPDQPYEQMQTDVGHARLRFRSCSAALILETGVEMQVDAVGYQRAGAIKEEKHVLAY